MSVLERRRPAVGNGSTGRQEKRRLGARLSREHWWALLAGVVAFVLVAAALADRREMTTVVVAGEEIPAATPVTPDMVRTDEVPADSRLVDGMVTLDEVSSGRLVTTRHLAEGEPVTAQAVSRETRSDGLRAMSLPVAPEHAADGELRTGDRVDVLGVLSDEGEVGYVVTDVEVLGVSTGSSGSVGSAPTEFAVTVAVDAEGALRLARALAATGTSVEVVRSTGAEPVQESEDEGEA